MAIPAIEHVQHEKLVRLIESVLRSNAFYAAKLERAGCKSPPSTLEAFKATFPLTTKREFAEDHEIHLPYGTNLTDPLSQYTRYHQTSGTSGSPIRWLDTNESWQAMTRIWEKVFHAAGVDDRDRVLFAFSFGPFLGFWTAFEAAMRLGCLCLPGGGMDTHGRLNLITTNQITSVCCTPTYALRLGELAGQEGIDLGTVKTIIVAGEPGGGIPETRARIERLWPNAEVIDHHGMTEVGPVSTAHRGSPDVLHIIEESFIAEILDPETGRAIPPGDAGELVLTTLDRIASPAIRYRTGDLVRRALPDEAPPGLTCYRLHGGILGRIDDMVQVRGVNVYPGALERIVRRHPGIAEYQAILRTVREMTELDLHIEPVPDHPDPAGLVEILERDLRESLTLRVPVTLAKENSLPRFEMKARRWHRETS